MTSAFLLILAVTAPQPDIRLRYVREDTAAQCPAREAMVALVEEKLGYAPWSDAPRRTVQVTIEGTTQSLAAHVLLTDEDGEELGRRDLTSSRMDCEDLARALALAISIAIDPRAALGIRRPPLPSPPARLPPAERVVLPIPDEKPAPSIKRDPRRWQPFVGAGAGVLVDTSVAPFPAPGAFVRARVGLDAFSLGLEAAAHAPVSRALRRGSVQIASVFSSALLCWRAGWLGVCGVAGLGLVGARGVDLVDARVGFTPQVRPGVRLELDFPIFRGLAMTTMVQSHVNLIRVRLTDSSTGNTWWEQPLVGLMGGAGLRLDFP